MTNTATNWNSSNMQNKEIIENPTDSLQLKLAYS